MPNFVPGEEDKLWIYERIMARSYPNSKGCIEWLGATKIRGYGVIAIKKGSLYRCHRLIAFCKLNFNLFSSSDVCHRCDNPRCINPEHLFIGSRRDNMQDAAAKGRTSGFENTNSLKTHCLRGHEYTEANIYKAYRNGKLHRRCATCSRAEVNERNRIKRS